MRILGPNGTAASSSGSATRRTGSGGAVFSLDQGDAGQAAKGPTALRTVGGIDALMALQGQDDPAERRKRAVKKGRVALDALDDLKLQVLDGTLSPATLGRLQSAAADLRDASGDPGLDGVIDQIDLRVQVEIAKLSVSR